MARRVFGKKRRGGLGSGGGGGMLCTLLLKRIISFIIIWNQDHRLLPGPAASGSEAHSRAAGLPHTSLDRKRRRTAKSRFICLKRTGSLRRGPTCAPPVSRAFKHAELEAARFQGLKKHPPNPDFFFFFGNRVECEQKCSKKVSKK